MKTTRRLIGRTALSMTLATALITTVLVTIPRPAAADPPVTYRESSEVYRPLTPARLLDTRAGVGGARRPISAQGRVDLQVLGRGGLPSTGVRAVVVTVVASGSTRSGSVTVYRTGTRRPPSSTLSYAGRTTTTNTTLVAPDRDGRVSIHATTSTHATVTVLGWFPTGSTVTPVAAVRLLNTRSGIGAAAKPLAANRQLDLAILGRGGLPSTGVGAVLISVSAFGAPRGGSVTAYRTGSRRPADATLAFAGRTTATGSTLVRPGPDGRISIHSTATTDVAVSLLGWFPAGGDVAAVDPARLLNTRTGVGAAAKPLANNAQITLKVLGRGGLPPTGVGSVLINVTAAGAPRGGSLTAYRTGTRRPAGTALSFPARATVAATTLVEPDPEGRISLHTSAAVDVSVSIVGFSNRALRVELETPATTTVLRRTDVGALDAPAKPGDPGSVTISSPPPPVGEIVYVPPQTSGSLAGAVGRVVDARPVGEQTELDIVGVQLDEAFTSGSISGVSSSVRTLSESARSTPRRDGKDRRSTQALPKACQNGSRVEVEAKVSPEVRVEVDITWGLGKRTHVRVIGVADITTTAHIVLAGKVECTWEPFLPLPLPPVGAVKPELSFQMKLSGEARLGIERTRTAARVQTRIGVDWWAGESPQWIRTGSLSGELDAPKAKVEGKIALEVGAALTAKLAGMAGLEVFFGPFVEVVFDPSQASWWRYDGGIRVRAAFVVEAFVVQARYELAAAVLLRVNLARAALPVTISPPADIRFQHSVLADGTRIHWHDLDCEFLDLYGVRVDGPTRQIARMESVWISPRGILDRDNGRPQSSAKTGWDFYDRSGITIPKAGYLGTWTLQLRAYDKAGKVIGARDLPIHVRDRNRATRPVGLSLTSPATSAQNPVPFRATVWDPDRLVSGVVVQSGPGRETFYDREYYRGSWREGDVLIVEGRVPRTDGGRCTHLYIDAYDVSTAIYFEPLPRGFPMRSRTCRP